MKHLLDVFDLETWAAFRERGCKTTGFKERQRRLADRRVGTGDILLCYLRGLSAWCGALEVVSDTSEFIPTEEPYPVRFNVEPIVILEPEHAVPVHAEKVWNTLSFTNKRYWSGHIRSPLNVLKEDDGRFLMDLLKQQKANPEVYPFTSKGKRILKAWRNSLAGG